MGKRLDFDFNFDFDFELIGRVISASSQDRNLLLCELRSYTFLVFLILVDNLKCSGLVHLNILLSNRNINTHGEPRKCIT